MSAPEDPSSDIPQQVRDALPIAIQVAAEGLRQERETFDQRKRQDQIWFVLRVVMGSIAAFLLPAIAIVSFYIVLADGYSVRLKLIFAAAVVGDLLGVLIAVWKVVLPPGAVSAGLAPVTELPDLPSATEP